MASILRGILLATFSLFWTGFWDANEEHNETLTEPATAAAAAAAVSFLCAFIFVELLFAWGYEWLHLLGEPNCVNLPRQGVAGPAVLRGEARGRKKWRRVGGRLEWQTSLIFSFQGNL